MSKLEMLSQLPDVLSVVVGDQTGALTDAQNEADAESVAGVMGFLSTAIKQSGEGLGFGLPQKLSISGPAKACLVYLRGNVVLTIYVDPKKNIGAIEKKIEQSLQI